MDKQQAYYSFWSSFSIPAYDENSVPDGAGFPRIDYQVLIDDLDAPVFPMAKIWYRDTSWEDVDKKVAAISAYIENMEQIAIDNGYMNIEKGNSFAQRIIDEKDQTVKGYLLNLQVEFFTRN